MDFLLFAKPFENTRLCCAKESRKGVKLSKFSIPDEPFIEPQYSLPKLSNIKTTTFGGVSNSVDGVYVFMGLIISSISASSNSSE